MQQIIPGGAMDTHELLSTFIRQAHQEDLKTQHFPKDFKSLKMKVSFGQGVPARVPWISFFPPEMSTSNGFYPVYLYYKSESKLILSFGVSETHDYGQHWDESVTSAYPKIADVIENPPRYGDSWVFKEYLVNSGSSEFFLQSNGIEASPSQLDGDLNQILDIFAKNLDREIEDKTSTIGAGLFYMEKQLEDFIIANWDKTDLGKELDLIYEDGVLVSQQFRTSIGPIDILAKDKKTGDFVVIELKRNQTSDDTVGQAMRYMGWVSETFNNPTVRAVIVAGKFDQKLEYAQKMMPQIEVYLYEVDFKLREHKL